MAENLLEHWSSTIPPEWASQRCPYEVVVNYNTVTCLMQDRRRWLNSDEVAGEYFFDFNTVSTSIEYCYRFSDQNTAFMFKMALA